jgi:hypothetical protein
MVSFCAIGLRDFCCTFMNYDCFNICDTSGLKYTLEPSLGTGSDSQGSIDSGSVIDPNHKASKGGGPVDHSLSQ